MPRANALGKRCTKISIRPERATQTLFLVPQIPFVIRRTIFFQNPQIPLLKCLFPVMLFLAENVLSHRFEMRRAYAEKTVTILPMKVPKTCIRWLCKFRRVFFENFENLGRRRFFSEIAKDVNMIRNTANRN